MNIRIRVNWITPSYGSLWPVSNLGHRAPTGQIRSVGDIVQLATKQAVEPTKRASAIVGVEQMVEPTGVMLAQFRDSSTCSPHRGRRPFPAMSR